MSRYRETPSNIRVSVTFDQPTVFAGEDVACTITFKNTAREQGGSPSRSPSYNGAHTHGAHKVTPGQPVAGGGIRPGIPRDRQVSASSVPAHLRTGGNGHRVVNSVNSVATNGESAARQRHGRSLSILSMGTDSGTVFGMPRGGGQGAGRGHERTISVQTAPRRSSAARQEGQEAPKLVITEQDMDPQATVRAKRPSTKQSISGTKNPPGMMHHEFKFPAAPPPEDSVPNPDSAVSPRTDSHPFSTLSPPTSDSSANPLARVLSQSSTNDSSRGSIDLFSEAMSTHSDDQSVFSELVPQQMARLLPRPSHVRNNSRLGVREAPRGPETIIMGYAQIMGSFTLEGSLVNQAPFEEIKRKGVVGSHGGGGVVGVERTKRDSGLFGAFGWGNIGESIGGLLGNGELSSIKEMGKMASSKSIPLVTTPPAILFVDLRLAPGESKSYSYRFTLPRGLPPSHKGRSMKVTYQLVIGTQRAGKGKEQQLKSVDVPFRVFGSVDNTGDILGHDLMSPYILLRDQAKTSIVDGSKPDIKPKKPPDQDGEAGFMSYISALLENTPSTNGSSALLSPTSPLASPNALRSPTLSRRHSSVADHPTSQADLVDLAILRSNHPSSSLEKSNTLSNKFDIARSGRHVATLYLPRPAYRLGETIHLVASFKNATIPTYALQVALETREAVDPAIAMRSPASVYRYTKKVHAHDAANALFATRLAFTLNVPANGTPEFVTSGISLDWRIRVKFVTPRLGSGMEGEDLLEEVGRDERGGLLQGVETLKVETFEVAVPVRVYGVAGVKSGECDVEGLVV